MYDIIIIGGGSGGLSFAKQTKQINKELKVAVFDYVQPSTLGTKWKLGGTCVNVGCIPKKLIHYSGKISDIIKNSKQYGWDTKHDFSWENMIESINNYILSLNWSYKKQLKAAGVEYFNNYAMIADNNTIKYEDEGETICIKTKYIVIATGCRPNYGNYPGSELCLTSDDLFWHKKHPGNKILVVGSGYIACETSCALKELGIEVVVMYRSKLLRKFDEQCVSQIAEIMERKGIKFIKSEPKEFKKVGDKILVNDELYDNVILAIGRTPCISNFGLDVKLSNGKILVDKYDKTSVDNIYAIGDVAIKEGLTDSLELTPTAIKSGILLAQRLFNNSEEILSTEWVPTTVFTSPEYGFAGLTTEEADKIYGKDNIEIWYSRYGPIENLILEPKFIKPRSQEFTGNKLWARQYANENKLYWEDICYAEGSDVLYNGEKYNIISINEKYEIQNDKETLYVDLLDLSPTEDTEEYEYMKNMKSNHLCKIITEKKTGKILGIHYVGDNAGEIIQGFALACSMNITKQDFDKMISIHPIAAEEFLVLDINRSSGKSFMKKEGCGGGSC